MIFTSFTDTVTVKRLAYTGDKGTKSTVAGVSYLGLFVPVDSNEGTIAMKIVGEAFKFSTDSSADIQVGDTLVYNSEDYTVKGIQRFNQKSLNILHCYLEKPQKRG